MRTITYKCDECKKEIGNKTHISLSFGDYSGIAIPPCPEGVANWCVVGNLRNQFMHFCKTECMKKMFDSMVSKVEKAKK